ncbi:acyltransferase [Streptomyces sp. VNUA116]|uniref:acyltransferase family protein n=1 Tax=Streptomyces sp. VNUA116 TaxID=3062449 RepID=UPI002676CE91|nr:acyltransferase [Streptomyces sp. VNUA116]WKU47544.1 acyltransferase [Streptomyces sp. VNUA116]
MYFARRGESDRRPAGEQQAKSRLYALDGLRIIAALMVVAFHLLAYDGTGWTTSVKAHFPSTYLFSYYGWLGVQLFFLISGFVISMSCWGKSVGDFAISRVTRLYPAYWFAVLVTAFALWLFPGVRDTPTLSNLAVNLTMFQDPMNVDRVDSVYWSLWVEVRFYLLFTLIAWKGLTYRRLVAFCLGWAVAGLIAAKVDNELLTTVVMPEHCWYFIAGIALYLIYRFKPNALLWAIVAFCFLLGQHFLVAAHRANQYYAGFKAPLWPALILLAVIFAVMAAVAVGLTNSIIWRWLPTAGALTLPLYLLHEDLGWIFIRHTEHRLHPYAIVAILVTALLIASWLVHRYVERPLGRWMRRVFKASLGDVRMYSHPDSYNITGKLSDLESLSHPYDPRASSRTTPQYKGQGSPE